MCIRKGIGTIYEQKSHGSVAHTHTIIFIVNDLSVREIAECVARFKEQKIAQKGG